MANLIQMNWRLEACLRHWVVSLTITRATLTVVYFIEALAEFTRRYNCPLLARAYDALELHAEVGALATHPDTTVVAVSR